MDILGGLNRFRENSYNTILDHRGDLMDPNNLPGSPQHGKADDYGLRGAKPNYPMNSMGGRRMAGQGIAGAIVGELAPHAIEPIRQVIQPAFIHVISETFGVGMDIPKIAQR